MRSKPHSKAPTMAGRARTPQTKDVSRTMAGKLGARMEKLAADLGMNAEQFGGAIGKSSNTVWSYFRGIRAPHVDDLPTIAKVLKVSVRELFPE